MKKILKTAAVLGLALGLFFPFQGAHMQTVSVTAAAAEEAPNLEDKADLLTDSEEEVLSDRLNEISDDYGCQVAVVTVNSTGSRTATEYAERYFKKNGYGYGTDQNGIILLISAEDRNWALTTHGDATRIFTDGRQKYMSNKFVPYLSDDEYAEAFSQYAGICNSYLAHADADDDDSDTSPLSAVWIPVSFGIGAGIGLIILLIAKSRLKTVHFQKEAGQYAKEDTFHLTDSKDIYLYTSVTKTPKPKAEDSSSDGGGDDFGGSSGSF